MGIERKNPENTRPGSAPYEDKVIGTGRATLRLRLYFLAPLTAVIMAAVGVSIADLYRHQHTDIQQGVVRVRASALELYADSVRDSARALRTLMHVLGRDEALRAALARRDRAALLARAAPMFEDLRREYGITHFYFSGPDRVNLLRVHAPDRYGDTIDRFTTLQAERGGAAAHGVELGPLGLFTLRLVVPWREEKTGRLLGYVELGMEVDHVIEHIRNVLAVDLFVLIDKKFLKRKDWEDGTRAIGRTPDWERFAEIVVSLHGGQAIPPALAARLAQHAFAGGASMMEVVFGGSAYRAALLPLQDAAGRDVARLALLVDISPEVDTARHAVYIGSLTGLVTGGALFVFFWWLVGRVGRRIERDERALEELAMRDGLTGLYNHRTFDSILGREITRAQRFKHPLSLLMLDIDYFKRVNDSYGHQAGDEILRGLSAVIGQLARGVDSVCRYGGEEITIVLPETALEGAAIAAERIRSTVENHPFDIGGGKNIPLTVSIGVAAFPAQAATAEALVAAADQALYGAKEGGRNRARCYKKSGAAELSEPAGR
jgi:diguanylate cyclase (GGDEF)-like protein